MKWNPAWSVATILTGLLSFMLSDDITTGSINSSDNDKRALAARSHAWNISQKKFREAFPDVRPPIFLMLHNLNDLAALWPDGTRPSEHGGTARVDVGFPRAYGARGEGASRRIIVTRPGTDERVERLEAACEPRRATRPAECGRGAQLVPAHLGEMAVGRVPALRRFRFAGDVMMDLKYMYIYAALLSRFDIDSFCHPRSLGSNNCYVHYSRIYFASCRIHSSHSAHKRATGPSGPFSNGPTRAHTSAAIVSFPRPASMVAHFRASAACISVSMRR